MSLHRKWNRKRGTIIRDTGKGDKRTLESNQKDKRQDKTRNRDSEQRRVWTRKVTTLNSLRWSTCPSLGLSQRVQGTDWRKIANILPFNKGIRRKRVVQVPPKRRPTERCFGGSQKNEFAIPLCVKISRKRAWNSNLNLHFHIPNKQNFSTSNSQPPPALQTRPKSAIEI